ncbi:MAG: histidine triad nucleotide-binding protein [Candidatus Kerfeldbacteria bacterium]|nr:histidine triad nucleotide-binding protein [Candidatus Kerfeldbacteria bacterium]
MNPDCLFCKIAAKELPATVVYEDDAMVAFKDIKPVAPVHVLIVPRKHAPSVAELAPGDTLLVGEMIRRAQQLAEELGIADRGYRLVFNVRKHAGQVVDHIHLHLIGGQALGRMA